MNERIKELADKIWAEEYWDNPNTDLLLRLHLNKFAELVIRETVKTIINSYKGKINPAIALNAVEEKLGVKYERTD